MHRNKLLQLLERYKPSSAKEDKTKQKVIEFINANHNCFDRKLEIGHITGSSWLLNKQGDCALLMHHAKLDIWCQPGGHADGNSDIFEVAIKEAQEESGIQSIIALDGDIFDIDIHAIPANSRDKAHLHYDIRFLLQVIGDEELQINEEAKELRWVSKNEIPLLTTEESIIRMHKKWTAL